MMKQRKKRLLLNCMIPLLLGAVFYCPKAATLFNGVPFLRNHLPDMCWSYALVSALVFIFSDDARSRTSHKPIALCALVSTIWGTAMECLQLTSLVPGTFDPLDIVLELLAAFVAAGVIILFGRTFYEEEKDYCDSTLS